MEYKMNRHQLDTEDALRESEERLRKIIDQSPISMAIVSMDGTIEYINRRAVETFGYLPADIPDMDQWWVKAYPDQNYRVEVITQWMGLVEKSAADGSEIERREYRVTCKDGTNKTVIIFGMMVSGKVFVIFEDITERKRVEEALQESEKKYRVLVETMNEGLGIQDKNGLITYMNRRACEMFGYKPEELLGRPIDILFDEEGLKTFKSQMAQRRQGKEENYEVVWRRKDGGSVHTIVSPHVVFDANGNYNGSFGVFIDITERKQAEEERERLNRELEIKNKELEQIIYAASHDLKSPLVNINGYSSELKNAINDITRFLENKDISSETRKDISSLVKELPESFGFISTSVSRMDALLNGLLQFSRSGKVDLKIEAIDMNMLLSGILSDLNYRLKEAGVNFEVADLPQCKGDREEMIRIFTNLMENAVKYLDPARKGAIKVTGHIKDNLSIYCVEDNGIGIAAEHQKQIFHIFHQLDPSKTGEGLGLAIVQRMVERHGGKIWLESEADKGCRFYVALPI